MIGRRDFLKTTGLTVGALAMGPTYWRKALAQSPTNPGPGPYGPLGAADAFGVALPPGFTARVVAASGSPVGTTGYVWPLFPDGKATFAQPDGGFVLTVNSEIPGGAGGASSITFDRNGSITGARQILSGTSTNCGGGSTPWGTWLSCEEIDGGQVWECDPLGRTTAVPRPAMGRFTHEAAVVDPNGQRLYMTEDEGNSGFYRFTPARYPDLSEGILEIATPGSGGRLAWVQVPDPTATRGETRTQVPGSMKFKRGEGLWFDTGVVYFSTTSDDRIWAYDVATEVLELLYDGVALGDAAPLRDPDQLNAHPTSGDLFVCEDADDLQIVMITQEREVAPFAQLSGPLHQAGTEFAGTTFDPKGERLFFSSQRGGSGGLTFEVTGPFRSVLPRRPLTLAGQAAVGARQLALRAKPAARLSTVRKQGLAVGVDAGAGVLAVRLRIDGQTILSTRRTVKAGRLRLRLRPRANARKIIAREARGRRVRGTLELRQGGKTVTRPIVLTR